MQTTKEIITKTIDALKSKGYIAFMCENKNEALDKIKAIIPLDASVMNGASVTLEQIGFIDLLKSENHQWKNLHKEIVNEKDTNKQAILRKQALLSDYYLGSVHALVETGEYLVASNTGSQLPHIAFSSKNLILVVSSKKIVRTIDEALKRIDEIVIPLEDKRMMNAYNMHTQYNKLLISKGEFAGNNRHITFIIINEDLGY